MEWGTFPMFCVESGSLFSFVAGENERDAAKEYICKIMGLKGATLSETIIVCEDYRGKRLATFKTEDLLLSFSNALDLLRWEKQGDEIRFVRTPIPRRSRFEAWQDIYRKGQPMWKLRKCHWIAQGYRRNPVTGEML